MKLPRLTHLQFYIVNIIGKSTYSGRAIMQALKDCGEPREGSAFYQLMNRLEVTGIIKGNYRSIIEKKTHYRERFYTLTPLGINLHNEALKFYNHSPL